MPSGANTLRLKLIALIEQVKNTELLDKIRKSVQEVAGANAFKAKPVNTAATKNIVFCSLFRGGVGWKRIRLSRK